MSTSLDDIHEEMRDFRSETNENFKAFNSRLRNEEAWTARLQGAGLLIALLGVGNVIALMLQQNA